MKKIAITLAAFLTALSLFGCTSEKSTLQIHETYTTDYEFLYFNTPYTVTAYKVEFHYNYLKEKPCYNYKLQIVNKNEEELSRTTSFHINGVYLSESYRPYLKKGDIVGIIVIINSSKLSMVDESELFAEFSIKLTNIDNNEKINIFSVDYTFDMIKTICQI